MTAERDRLAAEKAEVRGPPAARPGRVRNARRRAERERSDFLQFAAMDMVRRPAAGARRFRARAEGRDRRQGIRQRRRADLQAAVRNAEEAWAWSRSRPRASSSTPTIHEAVQREQTEDAEDQAILGELQRGYNFKGKLLRPAWVKVAVHP